jgi:hypothetical protein
MKWYEAEPGMRDRRPEAGEANPGSGSSSRRNFLKRGARGEEGRYRSIRSGGSTWNQLDDGVERWLPFRSGSVRYAGHIPDGAEV